MTQSTGSQASKDTAATNRTRFESQRGWMLKALNQDARKI